MRYLCNFPAVFIAVYVLGLCTGQTARAEIDWLSFTLDNDLFVGGDSGYTNGVYFATYDVGLVSSGLPDRHFWTTPLMWTMPKYQPSAAINAYSFGQAMNTPSDISKATLEPGEMPYSGVLFFSNIYLAISDDVADRVSTTLGVVGPASGAEKSQKFIHRVLGSTEPQGWDNQLKNEVVFEFSRGRLWRSWVSQSSDFDFLLRSELSLGTLSSVALGGMTLRYGRQLGSSFATPLFASSRTSNPASIDGGWYFYAGAQAIYTFNQIAADGNTFQDSPSVDYEKASIGLSAGFAYSWQRYSLTLAVNDRSVLEDKFDEANQDLTRYGTLTIAVGF